MSHDSLLKGLILILLICTLSACAQPKPLYVYGDYSETYYRQVKTDNEENRLKLTASMEKAIAEADQSRTGRVPPGMYANLGYLYLKAGNPQKALSNFEQEKATYPEASHFMDRIIAKVKLAEGEEK